MSAYLCDYECVRETSLMLKVENKFSDTFVSSVTVLQVHKCIFFEIKLSSFSRFIMLLTGIKSEIQHNVHQ